MSSDIRRLNYAEIVKQRSERDFEQYQYEKAQAKIEQNFADERMFKKQKLLKEAWDVYLSVLDKTNDEREKFIEKSWELTSDMRQKKFEIFFMGLSRMPFECWLLGRWVTREMYDFVKRLWRHDKRKWVIPLSTDEKKIFRFVVCELSIFKYCREGENPFLDTHGDETGDSNVTDIINHYGNWDFREQQNIDAEELQKVGFL